MHFETWWKSYFDCCLPPLLQTRPKDGSQAWSVLCWWSNLAPTLLAGSFFFFSLSTTTGTVFDLRQRMYMYMYIKRMSTKKSCVQWFGKSPCYKLLAIKKIPTQSIYCAHTKYILLTFCGLCLLIRPNKLHVNSLFLCHIRIGSNTAALIFSGFFCQIEEGNNSIFISF